MRILAPPLAGLALLALAALPAAAAKPAKKEAGDVAAILNGKPVYQDTLNSPDLAKARREVYRLEEQMLRRVVLGRLAKEKPKEFAPPRIEVTDEEVRQVYEQARLKSRGTLDSFKGRIRAYIVRNKGEQQERELFEKAVRKGYVKPLLKSPPPFLFRLAAVKRGATTRGPAKARIHIVEFSDFQ